MHETQQLMATLKQRGIAFFAAKERETTATDLRQGRLLFLYTDLAHDDVVDKHKNFEQFLTASFLEERSRAEHQP